MVQSISERLNDEYLKRRARNSAFSLRSFARYLDVGIATVTDIQNGKRRPSKTTLLKLADKLEFSPLEIDGYLEQMRAGKNKEQIKKLFIQEDVFQTVADWYHYAIVEIARIQKHKATPNWISKKLGIKNEVAANALERLARLKLIKIKKNKITLPEGSLKTSEDIPSSAIRKRHRQVLELGIDSLERDSVDEREFFSITLAIDPTQIPKAKEQLRKAIRKIEKTLENGEQTEIYNISGLLFPLKERE